MSMYFTSDLHLGHIYVALNTGRPFTTVEEHDQAIIDNWNKVVRKKNDIVWVLGDLSVDSGSKHALEIIKSLNGRKRLVTGNHDRAWAGKSDFWKYVPDYLEAFEVVTPFARAKIGPENVMLSHFPYAGDHYDQDRFEPYRLRSSLTTLLHGHTHSANKYSKFAMIDQVHVGVDAWNFTPVSQDQISTLLKEQRS